MTKSKDIENRNNVSHVPQPKASDAQHRWVLYYLECSYLLYESAQGSRFLVNPTTMEAIPLDDKRVIDDIKARISYNSGRRYSDTAIRDAITALRGRPCYLQIPRIYIRVIQGNGFIALVNGDIGFFGVAANDVLYYNYQAPPGYFYPNAPPAIVVPPAPHFRPRTFMSLTPINSTQPNIHELFELTNLPKDQKLLVITWLVLSLMPNQSLFALELTGEPQSGKTEAMETLLAILDPQEKLIKRAKRRKEIEKDMTVKYIHALDGIEELKDDAQQLLVECLEGYICEIKGRNHISFEIKKPVILTAVETVITDPELRKRSISIDIPYQPNCDLKDSYSDIYYAERLSKAFYGLLNLTSFVLAYYPNPQLNLQRNVPKEQRDFCQIGVLVSQILEGNESAFWDQFDLNGAIKDQKRIDENSVACAIQRWIKLYPHGASMTVHEWMSELNPYAPHNFNWPASPQGMSRRLKEAAQLLRPYIQVVSEGVRGSYGRYTIRWSEAASQDSPNQQRKDSEEL
ncbi:hypothetical protein [Halorhodospira halochloris]|uniref:hypothetical protein n=1 Tax=Halorhodospira halochloris TaxID=1052 RepID=UPI001EE7CFB2|nr:hypothetical protein [Halorhodospira halochloris]MCG5547536.1 hypothetical protein [Halorhodospira halochloris]